MVAISHAIERVVRHERIPARLYAGFQRLSLFVPERERYRALAAICPRVVVWGIADAEIEPIPGLTVVALDPTHELARGWWVVAVHPSYTSALVAEDVSGQPATEPSRDFTGTWTFDVASVAEVERRLAGPLGLACPAVEPTADDLVAQLGHAEAAAAELSGYLERALARERAAAASRDRLTSMIVHDLNNPLAYLAGIAELLLAGGLGDLSEQQRRYVGGMVRSADEMGALVGDILDMQRIEQGQLRPSIEDVPLEPLVRRAVETSALADRIELDLHPAAVSVRADARLLQRVVSNLISNARKYGGGGPVRIETRRVGERVQVAVVDQGPGFPAAALPTVFDAYRQGSNAGARTGWGLGLAFVRQAVEAMGGHADAANEPEGGARVQVTLPAQ